MVIETVLIIGFCLLPLFCENSEAKPENASMDEPLVWRCNRIGNGEKILTYLSYIFALLQTPRN
jgi:hypothetical protein